MIHTIVVGVDGTPESRHALEWAASRARELHAEVVPVFAMPVPAQFVLSVPPLPADPLDELRDEFGRHWCQPLIDAGVSYRPVVMEEDPAHALLDLAEREHADLIVIGAHGNGGMLDRITGGVGYRVSHRAPCPVVIVPSTSTA